MRESIAFVALARRLEAAAGAAGLRVGVMLGVGVDLISE